MNEQSVGARAAAPTCPADGAHPWLQPNASPACGTRLTAVPGTGLSAP